MNDISNVIPLAPERCAIHLDGHANPMQLANLRWLEKVIRNVAEAADMIIINVLSSNVGMEPCRGDHPHESGYSVQALITTSHIAIHTWPKHGLFMFDLVSCKPFEERAICKLLEDNLGISDYKMAYSMGPNADSYVRWELSHGQSQQTEETEQRIA